MTIDFLDFPIDFPADGFIFRQLGGVDNDQPSSAVSSSGSVMMSTSAIRAV